jgi:phospholipid/cholesterol/gamma-HCH transport system permease protein
MATFDIKGGTAYLTGILDADSIPKLMLKARKLAHGTAVDTLDLSGIESIDSAGVCGLEEIIVILKRQHPSLKILAPNPKLQQVIVTFSSEKIPKVPVPARHGFFERAGQTGLDRLDVVLEALIMASEIFYWSIVGIWNRGGRRKGAIIQQSMQLGYKALPVVGLLSFIIGFILSLQSGVQLRMYGGDVFLADLLAVTMVREMGPLITAIIVAGRSGSAIASEVATMQVSEEIDALRMMALDPIRYVIVPKFHAITIVMPVLVAFSILVAELGGLVIAMGTLDLSATTFFTRSVDIITLKDLVVSFSKSTVFAWLIVIIGAHCGMRVRGGAEGVGKATTASVVAAIFAVIIADVIFSLLYLP